MLWSRDLDLWYVVYILNKNAITYICKWNFLRGALKLWSLMKRLHFVNNNFVHRNTDFQLGLVRGFSKSERAQQIVKYFVTYFH